MPSPLQHHVLEEMCKAGASGPLIGRTDMVPDVDRHDGQFVILMLDYLQSIPKLVLHGMILLIERSLLCCDAAVEAQCERRKDKRVGGEIHGADSPRGGTSHLRPEHRSEERRVGKQGRSQR